MSVSNKSLKILSISAFSIAGLGVLILVVFFWLAYVSDLIVGSKVNLNTSSAIGDFVGGMVGAIWALAATLLYFAALMYQKKSIEISEQQRIDLIEAYKLQNEAYKHQSMSIHYESFQNNYNQSLSILLNLRQPIYKIINEKDDGKMSNFDFYAYLFDTSISPIINPRSECKVEVSNLLKSTFFEQMDLAGYFETIDFCNLAYSILLSFINEKKSVIYDDYFKQLLDNQEYTFLSILSDQEIKTLAFYSFVDQNLKFQKEYIQTSSLFKNRVSDIQAANFNFKTLLETLNSEKA